jgi:hypothetical protein
VKIIFLDMDGVLCTNRAHIAQGYPHMPNHHPFMDALDREGVGMLTALERKVGNILYVLSSTWRKQHTKEEMEEYLKRYNWTGEFHPDWRTDDLGPIRGNEIERWLQAHPDTDNYIILDDSGDMLESQKYHFVQTDEYNGIMAENYWHMERIFEKAMTYDTN